MGQKTNCNFTRLSLHKNYLSNWYANKFEYSNLLLEDNVTRFYIKKSFGKLFSLATINITRVRPNGSENLEKVIILIKAQFPSLLKTANFVKLFTFGIINNTLKSEYILTLFNYIIKYYLQNVAKRLGIRNNKHYQIQLFFIKNKFEEANLIANYIAKEILRRKDIVTTIKQTLIKIKLAGLAGAFLQVSGRFQGAERATHRWGRFGSVPSNNFKSKILFAKRRVYTRYGILGIQVKTYFKPVLIDSEPVLIEA